MSEGATTVGSIVGKLKIDDSDWNRKLDIAEVRAHALGRVRPNIKVTADTDDAVRKLTAADVASRLLTQTMDKLNIATEKGTASGRGYMRHWQVVALLIAALVPLMGPLAGYAVGVGGAFLGMGSVGVLAILGIKKAMEDGTATGDQYRAGIRSLKSTMDTLSGTAAGGMLRFFQQAVDQVSAAMPMLNGHVLTFSRLLGSTGNYLLSGVINSMRILNPLFVTAGVYLQNIAAGFDQWTKDGGLQQFADYALRTLPLVADTLGSLALLALHLIEALSPLGLVAMQVLLGISGALNALPVDVLGGLIAYGVSAAVAFRAWGFIAPLLSGIAAAMGQVGLATSIVSGPVGMVAIAVGALAGLLFYAATASDRAAAATHNYTAAVEADTGAIAANVKAAAAKALLDAGAYDMAQRLGISTKLVTDATLGNAEALATLTAQLEYGTAGSQRLKDRMAETGLGMLDLSNLSKDLLGAVTEQSGGVQGAVEDYKTLKGALGETVGAQQAAGSAIDDTTLKMIAENDAAGLLHNALTILNGGALDLAAAQTGLASANNSVTDAFLTNGSVVDGATTAAIANQQALQSQARAAQQMAEAVATSTGSSKAGEQAYLDAKAAIEAQMSAQGLLTAEVQAYIDRIYDVANLKVEPTKLDVDTTAAMAKLAALLATLNGLDGRRVGFTISAQGNIGYSDARNSYYDGKADGGTVGGQGTSRSDSNVVRLSRGEEVVREAAASSPGVRPLLKAINANPALAMAGLASGRGSTVNNTTHNWSITEAQDARAVANYTLSLQNEMAAV